MWQVHGRLWRPCCGRCPFGCSVSIDLRLDTEAATPIAAPRIPLLSGRALRRLALCF